MRLFDASFVLRAGLAFALLYPAVNSVSDPVSWLGYFPAFMLGIVPDLVLLHAFGIIEALLALWLLSGWRVRWPAAATLVLLLTIVVFNISQFQILFRDIAIAAMALALLAMPPQKRYSSPT
ncbi:MAG: hypothetical protein ACE5F4_02125 [Candidatus Paceibacteria bacterium]